MNKIILRLHILSLNKVYEVIFDTRLSFRENLKILNELVDLKNRDYYIFDPEKKIALKRDIPLKDFNFRAFKNLNLY
ncbi:MAG: hypothetical protein Q4B60_04170 [Erysipelotrichaceae bacterium]|nr:hypothetical protein [Erysipelotrichaceae bacterium]